MEIMEYILIDDEMSEQDMIEGLYQNYRNGYGIEELLTIRVSIDPVKYGRIIKNLIRKGVKFSSYLQEYAR